MRVERRLLSDSLEESPPDTTSAGSDFQSSELWGNRLLLCKPSQYMLSSYGTSGKLMQSRWSVSSPFCLRSLMLVVYIGFQLHFHWKKIFLISIYLPMVPRGGHSFSALCHECNHLCWRKKIKGTYKDISALILINNYWYLSDSTKHRNISVRVAEVKLWNTCSVSTIVKRIHWNVCTLENILWKDDIFCNWLLIKVI